MYYLTWLLFTIASNKNKINNIPLFYVLYGTLNSHGDVRLLNSQLTVKANFFSLSLQDNCFSSWPGIPKVDHSKSDILQRDLYIRYKFQIQIPKSVI